MTGTSESGTGDEVGGSDLARKFKAEADAAQAARDAAAAQRVKGRQDAQNAERVNARHATTPSTTLASLGPVVSAVKSMEGERTAMAQRAGAGAVADVRKILPQLDQPGFNSAKAIAALGAGEVSALLNACSTLPLGHEFYKILVPGLASVLHTHFRGNAAEKLQTILMNISVNFPGLCSDVARTVAGNINSFPEDVRHDMLRFCLVYMPSIDRNGKLGAQIFSLFVDAPKPEKVEREKAPKKPALKPDFEGRKQELREYGVTHAAYMLRAQRWENAGKAIGWFTQELAKGLNILPMVDDGKGGKELKWDDDKIPQYIEQIRQKARAA